MAGTVILILLVAASDLDDKDADMLRAISDSYYKNIHSFDFGSIDYVELISAGSDDAISRSPSNLKHINSFECNYIFDGKNLRRDRTDARKGRDAVSEKISGNRYKVNYRTDRLACNGLETILDVVLKNPASQEDEHLPNVFSGTRMFRFDFAFPLEIGMSDEYFPTFSGEARKALADDTLRRAAKVRYPLDYEGSRVVEVTLKLGNGVRTYLLDPARGAVPLKVVDQTQKNTKIVYYNDNINFVDGVYLPFLHTKISGGIVRSVVLKKVDFTTKPAPGSLDINFREPIALNDSEHQVFHKARPSWSPKALPRSRTPGPEIISTRPKVAPPPEFPAEKPTFNGRSILSTLGIACGLGAILYFFLRRRG